MDDIGTKQQGTMRIDYTERLKDRFTVKMSRLIVANNFVKTFEYRLGRTRLKSYPTIMQIEPTNHCVMSCRMCPHGDMKRSKGKLKFEDFQRWLDQGLLDFTPFVWLHHFGEPLLYNRIFDMVIEIKNLGVQVGLSINPTLLSKERANQIFDSGLDLLHISLDGANQQTYEYYRGPNANYQIAEENLRHFLEQKVQLKSMKPYVRMANIQMERSIKENDNYGARWNLDGVDEILFKRLESFDGSIERIRQLRQLWHVKPEWIGPCYYPWNELSVLYDGRVVPCCRDYEGKAVVGHLNENTIEEIWNGKRLKEFRAKHLQGRRDELELCKDCIDPNLSAPPFTWNGLSQHVVHKADNLIEFLHIRRDSDRRGQNR